MDLFTAAPYVLIVVLVVVNAWLVSRSDITLRRDD